MFTLDISLLTKQLALCIFEIGSWWRGDDPAAWGVRHGPLKKLDG
jgi:hypothetical protein